MQRWAFSECNERIDAEIADHGRDYHCPECLGIVRVRRGDVRVAHFFHRNEGSACRLQKKDGVHRAVQMWIIRQLGESSCTIELFFPNISRVADVAYHPAQVVFEVQRSSMDEEEARKRTESYWSIGWHVIWILHAVRYGRKDASAFEHVLTNIPHYFTDIGFRGGRLWDEWSCVRGRRRYWYFLPPVRRYLDALTVRSLNPIHTTIQPVQFSRSPLEWQRCRETSWSCHLEGDVLFQQLQEPKPVATILRIFLQRICLYVRLWWLKTISFH